MTLFRRSARTRLGVAAAVVTAATVVLAACNANPSTDNPSSAVFGKTDKGGTLTIYSSQTDIDFDPAKSQNLAITTQSFLQRRLTTWRSVPGQSTVPVPDLATDTGTTTDGGQTWKYTLKQGIKFSDGTPVTAQDVKYGIERSFAPLLSGGFNYHKVLLQGGDKYTGPYDGKSLDSIETPDDHTLIFHLNRKFGDWPWIVSQPAFAPVPKAKDNPQTFGKKPVGTGPYQVESRDAAQVVLSRNPFWADDDNRTAGPDKVVFKLGQDPSTAANALIADEGEAQSAFLADFVPAAQLAVIRGNPSAQQRLAEAGGGSLNELVINTQRVKDVRIRQAILYATDRQSYLTALGGTSRGTLATTNIPPALPGAEKFDLFNQGPTGDVEKAKSLLREAGVPNGIDLVLVTSDNSTNIAGAQALQESLKRANIRLKIRPLDDASYEDVTTQQGGSGYDVVLASWQADYPSAASMLQPSFATSEIGRGGFNQSRYSNPKVDALIDEALGQTDPAAAEKLWVQIDKIVTGDVATVPLVNKTNSFIYGSKIRNFYVPSFPAYPNYFKVSIAQ